MNLGVESVGVGEGARRKRRSLHWLDEVEVDDGQAEESVRLPEDHLQLRVQRRGRVRASRAGGGSGRGDRRRGPGSKRVESAATMTSTSTGAATVVAGAADTGAGAALHVGRGLELLLDRPEELERMVQLGVGFAQLASREPVEHGDAQLARPAEKSVDAGVGRRALGDRSRQRGFQPRDDDPVRARANAHV